MKKESFGGLGILCLTVAFVAYVLTIPAPANLNFAKYIIAISIVLAVLCFLGRFLARR